MSTHDDTIEILVDNDSIAGTFVTPATKMPGVLFVHGWGGCQEQYLVRAREASALGCVSLTFDLRGHAATLPQFETVSRENNLRDVMAAYDMLACHPQVDPSAIAVIGSSYGGYLAAILTTLRPIKWLALRAPALYMDSGWELPKRQLHKDQDLDTYRKSLIPAKENRALRAAAAFEGDVLLVESEFDHLIPAAVVSNYREAFIKSPSLTYRIMKGADHGLTDDACQRAYTVLLVNWLNEMIFGTQSKTASAAAVSPSRAIPEGAPRAR
jgi:dienelactone hydrolase